MRPLLFSAVIAGAGWLALTPVTAASLGVPGFSDSHVNAASVDKVGYWKRLYRRYGYPPPYAYYPPAYGYYPPPPAYVYPPPVYGYRLTPPASAYSPPVYGNEAPPPAADGNYPSAEGDYGEFRPQRETMRRPTASTAIIPRMALRALRQNSCHLGQA